jgi:flagellar hook-basal body complex protein FliE
MDLSAISALSGLSSTSGVNSTSSLSSLTGSLTEKTDSADGTMFDSILNTAIDNIKATNSYLSDAEDEEIKFALGETDNTHDLTIALQKASTALQYTVAIRDKLLDAYKELMQMQI